MNIKRLQLAVMRAFDHAEFDFNPGMNLLVGVNGVGKTTILDALRICVSKDASGGYSFASRPIPFVAEDIRGKAAAMTVRLFLELEKRDFEFLVHKQREHSELIRPVRFDNRRAIHRIKRPARRYSPFSEAI